MNAPINMLHLADDIKRRDRGRACVVLSQDISGQKSWAAKLAAAVGAAYIDLLDEFASDPSVGSALSSFSIENLFDLISERFKDKDLAVVTGIEFLIASLSGLGDPLNELASKVEYWGESPAIVIVMQYDRYLAKRKFVRFPNKVFVVDQRRTLALR